VAALCICLARSTLPEACPRLAISTRGGRPYEYIGYYVSPVLLRRIAKAKSVELQIGNFELTFGDDTIRRFKEWVGYME
jgi:hypothetical protein